MPRRGRLEATRLGDAPGGRGRDRRRTSGRTRPSARSRSARPGGPPLPPRTARRGATRAGREASLLFARATPPRVRAGRRRSASSTPWVSRRRDAAKQNARVVRETVVSATAGVRDSHRASASRGGEAETRNTAEKSGADDLWETSGVTRENGVNPKAQIFRYFARFGRSSARSTESVSASL